MVIIMVMILQDFMENAEKLCANEEKVKRLTEKWTGKWQEACSILEVSGRNLGHFSSYRYRWELKTTRH